METIYRIIAYISMIISIPICQATTTTMLTVPFQNVFLTPNAQIQASFSFGVQSLLFCFATNTQIVGVITWPFNGSIQTGSLPIFLKTNARFQGQFTDPIGVLTIKNNTKQLLQVGCLFGY